MNRSLKTTIFNAVLAGALALLTAAAQAAVPELISFQGKLADSAGRAITTSVQMTFKLYTAASGSALPVWTENQTVTPDEYGIYSVLLGDVAALNINFSTAYYLGVKVGTDLEMTPRYKLVSSAYSLYSINSGTAAYAVDSGTAAWASGADWSGIKNKPSFSGGDMVLASTQIITGQNTFTNTVTVSSDIVVAGKVDGYRISSKGPNWDSAYTHSQAATGAEHGAVSANTANMAVRRDASGNFAAGAITANRITNLAAPAAGTDAANMAYVDGKIQSGILNSTNAFTGLNTFNKAVNTGAAYQINGSTVVALLIGNEGYSLGIGIDAGVVNQADGNVFVGNNAGRSNTMGGSNSVLGANAGFENTTGFFNSFFGANAGGNNTTGNNNTLVGMSAGRDNTTGIENAVVGSGAGVYNYAGSANAILGYRAGFGSSANSFSNSTIIGYKAGYGLTTGSNNILLGWMAGDSLTTGANNIIIGYGQDADANATNLLNIGGAIYGNLSTGHVGIGTTALASTFTVVGTFKLADGTQGSGKMLISDADGLAAWTTVSAGDVYLASDQTFTGLNTFSDSTTLGGIIALNTGALQTTGGNARGAGAVDLQTERTDPSHVASGQHSFIGGGSDNTASGPVAVAVGGWHNTASNDHSTVVGGWYGMASGWAAFIGGGAYNTASGLGAAVAGGESNAANGAYSAVLGGQFNTAQADYSFAAGLKSSATAAGAWAIADSQNAVFQVGQTDTFGARFGGGYWLTGGNVGVGTTSPDAKLHVAGTFKLVDGTEGLNKVLTSNAAGLASWVTASVSDVSLASTQTFTGLNTFAQPIDVTSPTALTMWGEPMFSVIPAGEGQSLEIGYYAGHVNQGANNLFVGGMAGYTNTTGQNNTFLGFSSGQNNLVGHENAYMGYNAGGQNNGSFNVAFGVQAGYGDPAAPYSNSTLIGYQAGYALASGNNNILVGSNAGFNITYGSDNIIIGNNQTASADTSKLLNIGGVLFGDLNSGNVGINTAAPTSTLTVVGTFRLVDGTQGATKVLTSDANGLASWATASGGGDSLGSHIATMTLTANYGITSSTAINAGYYQIAGSTVLALSATGSVAVGPYAGPVNYGEL